MGIYGIELNNSLTTNGVDKMKHTETRMKKAENWAVEDFFKWFSRAIKNRGSDHSYDYIIGMNPREMNRLKANAQHCIIDPIEKIERDREYAKAVKEKGWS
jgi:hypothetical protein